MAYIGRDTDKISNVEVLDNITFDGSSSYTLQKGGSNFTPSSANTLLFSIDGVVQAGNFTVSGSTIDFGTAVAGTSTCDFILHYGVGLITAPSDGTVTTAKLADSSVSLAKLTATGTKDATTFLRGDNTFATPSGGKVLQVVQGTFDSVASTSSHNTFVDTGFSTAITPVSTSNKVLVFFNTNLQMTTGQYSGGINILRGSTNIRTGSTGDNRATAGFWSPSDAYHMNYFTGMVLDSPSSTSAVTYKIQFASGYSGQTVYMNRSQNGSNHFDVTSTMILMEIAG